MTPNIITSPPPARQERSFGFSDLLPASMVKDLRQTMRSPFNLTLVLFAVLLAYLLFYPEGGSEGSTAMDWFNSARAWQGQMMAIVFGMSFLVSLHAAHVIAADIRDRGSNFLQLCPLSAGRIIWGQFLSCAFQVFLLGLALLPLYWAFMSEAASASTTMSIAGISFPSQALILLILLMQMLIALFIVALMMCLAHLPKLIRLWVPLYALSLFSMLDLPQTVRICIATGSQEEAFSILQLSLLMALCLGLGIWAALLLARRHYSASAELRSGMLRLVVLLLTLLPFGVLCSLGSLASWAPAANANELLDFFTQWTMIATAPLLLDELLPRAPLPPSATRPALWRRCSTEAQILCMLIVLGLMLAAWPLSAQLGLLSFPDEEMQQGLVYLSAFALMFFTGTVATLALTDLIVTAKSSLRLVVYGLVSAVVSVFLLGNASLICADGTAQVCYYPIVNMELLTPETPVTRIDFITLGGIASAALLVLINVRAFRWR